MLRSLSLALLLAVPSLAFAAPGKGKALPASEHQPPVFLDETSVIIELLSRNQDGYGIMGHVGVSGVTSKTDMLRIDWKQKGKLLVSVKCNIGINLETKYADGECKYDDKPIKAKGAIDAELIYWDDQQEKEYLVRTFKVNVFAWKEQNKGVMWQIVPDDVLGQAWIWHQGDEETPHSGVYRRPHLYVWFASGDAMPNTTMRCTVDGKKIEDFELSPQGGSDTGEIEADHIPEKGDRITYKWQKARFSMDIYWGTKATLKNLDVSKVRAMGDTPGKWDCQLRKEGKAIRQILFTVDKEGMVQQADFNTGKGAIPTLKSVVMVEVRIPKDSGADKRINPAAMKKSMGFGLPWPDHPRVKEIHASYPPKSGYPDPK